MTLTDDPTFATAGYIAVDFLEAGELDPVLELHERAGIADEVPFLATPAQAWGATARWCDAELRRLVGKRVRTLLPGSRIFMSGLTFKGARGCEIKMHQDWTYTDEREERCVFIWCPLVDVDVSNGALAVVPGSHRWTDRIRPSRRKRPDEPVTEPTECIAGDLDRFAVTVPLRAGQAILFDPATLHGSPPNTTPRPRPAFTVAVAAEGARLLHFHLGPGGLEGFEVDEGFFTTHPYGCRPPGPATVTPWSGPVDEAELRAAVSSRTG